MLKKFFVVVCLLSLGLMAQTAEKENDIKTITLPILPKQIQVEHNDYSEILQAIHTVDMDVEVTARKGQYNIDAAGIELEIPEDVTIVGQIYFHIESKRESDHVCLLPKMNSFKFILSSPIKLKKSGFNISLAEFSSYEPGKVELRGEVFSSLAKFFVKKLLKPKDAVVYQETSSLLKNWKIHNAELVLRQGAVIQRNQTSFQLGDKNIVHIKNLVQSDQNTVHGNFDVHLELAQKSILQTRDVLLKPQIGGIKFSGDIKFSRDKISYHSQDNGFLALKNAEFQWKPKDFLRLKVAQLLLKFSKITYEQDTKSNNVHTQADFLTYITDGSGQFPVENGFISVQNFSVPGIHIQYNHPQWTDPKFECSVVGVATLENLIWNSKNYKQSIKIAGVKLAVGASTKSGWQIANDEEPNLNAFKIHGKVSSCDFYNTSHKLSLENINLKSLTTQLQNKFSISGQIDTMVSLQDQSSWKNIIPKTQIHLGTFSCNIAPDSHITYEIPDLQMRIEQQALMEYLKTKVPNQWKIPNQIFSKGVTKSTMGIYHDIAIQDSLINNLHATQFSVVDNEINVAMSPEISINIYGKRKIHRTKWVKEKKSFEVFGKKFEMEFLERKDDSVWKWEKIISSTIAVDIRGKILLSWQGSRLSDKSLHLKILCTDVDIKNFPDTLEEYITLKGTSLKDFIKQQLSREVKLDLIKSDALQLKRIRLGNLELISDEEKIILKGNSAGIFAK